MQHCSHGTRGRSYLLLFTDRIDMGGNTALMAPAVGFTFLDSLILLTWEASLFHVTRGRSNLPLYTDLIDKGGNTVLMATEVGVTFIDSLILLTWEASLFHVTRDRSNLHLYTDPIYRGGNTARMARIKNCLHVCADFLKLKLCYICLQVATAEPGRFVQLDYRKADAWSAGAVAYEVFGADNRFYNIGHGRLDSRSYMLDELLPLSDYVPDVVQRVVAALLERESKNVQCEILALFLNNGDYM
ncbi:hypothetical protein DPMN_133174 [Dreissena polymorpha]|uniref:Protein kinase domain-containing protein n=1 Tax=Dreissena polymorpha TaxID=45954 RepID=A0A9D4FUQ9_DREPO|nr:hypothetical protein DPMN_133174 [Dreissena polymorpha]